MKIYQQRSCLLPGVGRQAAQSHKKISEVESLGAESLLPQSKHVPAKDLVPLLLLTIWCLVPFRPV
jgi:hypothetical protein